MAENLEEPKATAEPVRGQRRRPGRSMFGPIVLIAVGFFLLFDNLGMLPDLNWGAALRLWPLFLIFAGLNLIVRMVPRPAGTFLSLLVSVVAVGTFSYVLLYAHSAPIFDDLPGFRSGQLREATLTFPAAGVERADVTLDTSQAPVRVFALEDSDLLLEARTASRVEVQLDGRVDEGRFTGRLDTVPSSSAFSWFDPADWDRRDGEEFWRVGLNPSVPTELELELSSGSATLDLASVDLTGLNVDGGSGSVQLTLPGGDYDMSYDVGSGSVSITLPAEGRHDFEIEGGSGSLTVLVPRGMPLRVEVVNDGSGSLDLNVAGLTRVGRGDGDLGEWESEDFDDGGEGITLVLDIGSGSMTLTNR